MLHTITRKRLIGEGTEKIEMNEKGEKVQVDNIIERTSISHGKGSTRSIEQKMKKVWEVSGKKMREKVADEIARNKRALALVQQSAVPLATLKALEDDGDAGDAQP